MMNSTANRHFGGGSIGRSARRTASCTTRQRLCALAAALLVSPFAPHALGEDNRGDRLAPPAPSADRTLAHAFDLSTAFKSVAQTARPAVGRIVGYTSSGSRVTGSGFVFRDGGYLLTNNHVVEGTLNLLVEFGDGQIARATIVGLDPLTDLAVIHAPDANAPVLPLAEIDQIDVGEWVVAVGFPMGLEQTVTAGIVSATNRRLNIIGEAGGRRGYEDFIQTDAAINKGNSGGPLLNLHGEVVGVNAAIVTQTGGSDGLGFAIPAPLARYVGDELIRNGRVVRSYLGVLLQDITPALARSYQLPDARSGVLLTRVLDGTPAGEAGLRPEDIVVAIDGRTISNVEELRHVVAMLPPGRTVAVTAYRDGAMTQFEVTLAEMVDHASDSEVRIAARDEPRATTWGRLGMRLADLDSRELDRLGERSAVTVRRVLPGQSAQLAGLQEDDVIVALNSRPLATLRTTDDRLSASAWLQQRIDEAHPGEVLRFTIRRAHFSRVGLLVGFDSNNNYVAIEIP